MSRFGRLADKAKPQVQDTAPSLSASTSTVAQNPAPSRVGRKAISGYFSPEMSLAMHMCARRNDMSLQALMAEAFNDVLRKYGESPVGN